MRLDRLRLPESERETYALWGDPWIDPRWSGATTRQEDLMGPPGSPPPPRRRPQPHAVHAPAPGAAVREAPPPRRAQAPPRRAARPPREPAPPVAGRRGSRLSPAARRAAAEDARLLAALQPLLAMPSFFPRLLFLAPGFAAITCLALAYIELVPLPFSAAFVVLPAAGLIITLGVYNRDWGRRALLGWVAGIIATIVYDCLRLSLVFTGLWGDPIPGIGRLALNDPDAFFAWGYVWRLAGNGGGMAIAYSMLPWRGVRSGLIYGTLIVSGLVVVLWLFPQAQTHFFPLTPLTALGGLAGHWVYGAVLGYLTARWLPPVELVRDARGRLVARLRHGGY